MKVAAGENHNIFLSDNLKILASGSNVYGQLGNGSSIPADQIQSTMNQAQQIQGQQQTISKIQLIQHMVDNEDAFFKGQSKEVTLSNQNHEFAHIACGAEHSFALTTTGELYSWGLGFKGQLGHGDFENKLRPTLVKNLSPSFFESGLLEELGGS